MTGRPAVLLDRDGTIIVERDYLSDPTLVVLEAGAGDGLAKLQQAGWPLVVLTNQSGVGRGYFTQAAVEAVNARTSELLDSAGVGIAGWFVCPHAPENGCDCRKPSPGLAHQAAASFGLDLTRSWMIGDKQADLRLGDAVGARSILVLTGHGKEDAEAARAEGRTICANLGEAADHILRSPAAVGAVETPQS